MWNEKSYYRVLKSPKLSITAPVTIDIGPLNQLESSLNLQRQHCECCALIDRELKK